MTAPSDDLASRPAGADPAIVVLSSLFPNARQPGVGLFVRERTFRVGRRLPLSVVSPQPWFPGQALLRRWRPGFRIGSAAPHEVQQGHDVWFPRFFSFPGALKDHDGRTMALAAYPRLRLLRRAGRLDVIDAHFGYPDGAAAHALAARLGVPCTITMRGTESRLARDARLRPLLAAALRGADRVFSVSDSLRQVALELGVEPSRVEVVGNGVDLQKFFPEPRAACRAQLGLPHDAPVIVTVGGLVERKGFHRVIDCLPALRERHPGLRYLVVGGPSPEGDMTEALRRQVDALDLHGHVHFIGPVEPARLRHVLGAADVFVLATRNEGWANVFLEAMACGLPVVATDVGGNREVVSAPELGTIVPFGDANALTEAVSNALIAPWDRDAIRCYAQRNTWDERVRVLEARFRALAHRATSTETISRPLSNRGIP